MIEDLRQTTVDPIKLRRTKAQFILGTTVDIPSYEIPIDTKTIRGLPSALINVTPFKPTEATDGDGPYTEIVVPDKFPPGSIMVFATQMEGIDPTLDEFCKSGAMEAFGGLDLVDLNVLLHRCDGEEKDATGKLFQRVYSFNFLSLTRWICGILHCAKPWTVGVLWPGRMDASIAPYYAIQRPWSSFMRTSPGRLVGIRLRSLAT